MNVLLLEDNHLDAELIGEGMRGIGMPFDLKRVVSRAEFVRAVEADEIDLILADFNLPAFDGMTALRIAQDQLPDTPFIFVSGMIGETMAVEALKMGATDYVVKQRLDRLPGTILRALAEAKAKREKQAAETVLRALNETLELKVAERTRERDRMWQLSDDLMDVCSVDDGRLVAVNPAWTAMLGWTPDELVGRSLFELIHPDDVAAARRELGRIEPGRRSFRFECRLRHKDGGHRLVSRTAVIDDGHLYGVSRDITADRAASIALRQAEEQLRQSQKMETIGKLTGGVAHDFNNLLTIVLGNLDSARRRLSATGDARNVRSIENAIAGAQRAAVLTQRLLAFSRRQPLQPKPIDVNQLLAGMSDLLGRTLGESIEIDMDLAPSLWTVEADANQLENALINLAVNARDAMDQGGRLSIRTRNVEVRPGTRPQGIPAGAYVSIAIADTGRGMSDAVLEQAFEPFFTTKDVGHGTGLGLSQVYGFVRQSGGQIRIESQLGQGTTVTICLPRSMARPVAAPAQPDAATEPPDHCGDETVLVVEDDEGVRAYTTEIVREMGYRVIEAANAGDALELLRADAGIDLLLSDVGLPGGMNGRELAEAAVAIRPGLKVLFATANTRSAFTRHGRIDPAFNLIPKPFTYAELADKIRAVLDEPDGTRR